MFLSTPPSAITFRSGTACQNRPVGNLVQTLVISGLISGTQPLTLMALLLTMAGPRPRRTGTAFIAGGFTVQAGLLVVASAVIGGTTSPASDLGHAFAGVRIGLGVVLIVVGSLLRRPPGKPIPEIPNALKRIQDLSTRQAFVAGIAIADWQGPIIASLALAATDVSFTGRLAALGFFACFGTGIPVGIMMWTTRSARAHERVSRMTVWVMRNRRVLAAWILTVAGLLLIGNGAFLLLTT